MKYYGAILVFFFIQVASAYTITIEDVRVSVTAESAAFAREQALDEAHQLAFQRLSAEYFPQNTLPLPSQDGLRDMVKDFSINREKTTPTSYTASLTFQFDEPQVLSWIQHAQQGSTSLPFAYQPYEENKFLKLVATYANYSEWHHIRMVLESLIGIQSFSIVSLSPQEAHLEITYGGALDKLKQGLLQKGILLSQQSDGWSISSTGQIPH